jgi:hypothetical protein
MRGVYEQVTKDPCQLYCALSTRMQLSETDQKVTTLLQAIAHVSNDEDLSGVRSQLVNTVWISAHDYVFSFSFDTSCKVISIWRKSLRARITTTRIANITGRNTAPRSRLTEVNTKQRQGSMKDNRRTTIWKLNWGCWHDFGNSSDTRLEPFWRY